MPERINVSGTEEIPLGPPLSKSIIVTVLTADGKRLSDSGLGIRSREKKGSKLAAVSNLQDTDLPSHVIDGAVN